MAKRDRTSDGGRTPRGHATAEKPGGLRAVYHEDCLVGMRRKVEAGSVDVAVTSPPYNIGKSYREYDDSREEAEYLRWIRRVSGGVLRVLSDRGSFFLNLGGRPSDPGWPFKVLRQFSHDFQLQNTIIWVKSIVIEDDESNADPIIRGHYKPVNSKRYLSGMSEYVFHLTKHGDVPLAKTDVGTPYKDKSNVARWDNDDVDLRDRGNVWFIPYSTVHAERPHPCVFPPKLPRMCIQLHGLSRTRLVLDPFVGTGSTGIAAAELGVAFVGFEIDPYYVEIARAAIQNVPAIDPDRSARAYWSTLTQGGE
jgi:site-specific DNA-methyltransferase (adenine-specific)